MAQEKEEGLILCGEAIELGQDDLVHILRLVGTSVFMIGAPALEVEIFVIADTGGIALKADTGGGIALTAEDLRKHGGINRDLLLIESNNAVTEAVHTGQHGGIAGGGGNMRGDEVVEGNAAPGIIGDMRGSHMLVAIVAHMIAAEALHTEENDIGFLCHNRFSLLSYRAPRIFRIAFI